MSCLGKASTTGGWCPPTRSVGTEAPALRVLLNLPMCLFIWLLIHMKNLLHHLL